MGAATMKPTILTSDNLGKIAFTAIALLCLFFVVFAYVRQSRLQNRETIEQRRTLLLRIEQLRDRLAKNQTYTSALETTVARRNERIKQLEAQIPTVDNDNDAT